MTMVILVLAGCAPEDCCHTSQARGAVLRVFFIGNSYTFVNDLPAVFARLACAEGYVVETGMEAQGGSTLENHVSSPETIDKIQNGNWNWVVLQEQSEVPAVPASRIQVMYPAVRKLINVINKAGAKPLLFLTWGHKDGDATFGIPNYPAMQAGLDQGYYGIANEQGVKVAPVGDAWAKATSQDSPFNLWQDDGSHPNESGTYLAACVFYAVIFQESPAGSDYRASLSQADSQALQAIAAETALK